MLLFYRADFLKSITDGQERPQGNSFWDRLEQRCAWFPPVPLDHLWSSSPHPHPAKAHPAYSEVWHAGHLEALLMLYRKGKSSLTDAAIRQWKALLALCPLCWQSLLCSNGSALPHCTSASWALQETQQLFCVKGPAEKIEETFCHLKNSYDTDISGCPCMQRVTKSSKSCGEGSCTLAAGSSCSLFCRQGLWKCLSAQERGVRKSRPWVIICVQLLLSQFCSIGGSCSQYTHHSYPCHHSLTFPHLCYLNSVQTHV